MSLPPELAERFELVGELGRGGMGVVYRARDRSLGRDVALKLLIGSRDEHAAARLRREGELTARLTHPNIVTLHSAGVAGGLPYLAYELVTPARTLDSLLPSLELKGRLELLLDVARALAHAHDRGVIHRDVKPENILVTESGAPKVADFGLAAAQDLARLTQTGAMLGTPGFMAPEQLSVRSKSPVGPPADVWSLGVLLYLMLTDELPFLATSALDLAVQIAGSDPEPPNRRVADLDPGLVAVCLKGLRREAKQRYADAGAFADDLQAVLAGNTPAALKARSAPAGTLVAFAGLLVVIGAGAMLAQGDAPSRGRADTVGERERESSTPSNQDEPLDRVELSSADAAAQLRKVLGISNPRTKLQAAWTLLRSRPPELQRTRALSLVQRLGREHPLLVLAHGERTEKPRDVVIADFVGNELISWRWEDVRRWRLPNGTGRAVPAPTAIRDLVTSGGDALICAHTDGVFRVTRLADAKALSVPGLERIKTIRSLVYTQQGQALALLSEGPAPLVIDLKLSVVRRLDSDYGAPLSIAFSPDGERLVSLHGVLDMIGIREGTAVLWDISGPSVLATQPTPVGCIRVTYSRDGKRIVFGSSSGHLLLYDDELKPQGRFETQGTSAGNILQGLGHSGHIRGLAFSKSGRRLFTCGKGNLGVGHELRCWDAESRELVWEALNRKRLPDSLAVSADGAYLAVGTSNAAVEVWIADPEAGL